MENTLPSIPAKRYFTIGEVGDLCGVKPHVLRYWEQEFTQLRPMKRRGNRRYYQHHEVLMIRKIRDLLYEQGFTISGARNKMQEILDLERDKKRQQGAHADDAPHGDQEVAGLDAINLSAASTVGFAGTMPWHQVRAELLEIRDLLAAA